MTTISWFSEQIRQRVDRDQMALDDSFYNMAGSVMDIWKRRRLDGARLIILDALDEILNYYHYKSVEVPENIEEVDGQLKYALHKTGLMVRVVTLEDNWQNHSCGPMLGFIENSGDTVALLPGNLYGYYYKDPDTRKKIHITKKNAGILSGTALCFYKPLPMKKLGIADILRYMKDTIDRSDLIMIVLVTLVITLIGMLEPQLYSLITGPLIKIRNTHLLIGAGVFLVCSSFAARIIEMARTLLMERIKTKSGTSIEASIMMRILSLPVSFFRMYSTGELSKRAESVNILFERIFDNIVSIGLSSLMSLLYIYQIFQFTPALVWPSLAVILTTLVLSLTTSFMQISISKKKMELNAKETGMSYDIMKGIRKIRLSGSEKRAFARWGNLYAQEARLEYDPPEFLKLNSVITKAIFLFGMILLYYRAVAMSVETSDFFAFCAAYGRVSAAFSALSGIAISAASIRPLLEMAEPILAQEPEVAEEKKQIEDLEGAIEVNNISFRYWNNGPLILKDMSFKIKAGEYVALVGRTGCGKSTLVRHLLGFEKPQSGTIYYDVYDLNTIDPRSLRKHIGVVTQNGQLFQGDIFTNIAISAPQLTIDEAWKAAEIAGIADDIRQMPMGMNTQISEGQGGISGGQKQRLMIARAIASKPRILIFDEATSALDNKTQKAVADALDGMGCTRLVIAHRLSTISHCDRILLMDGGRIAEEGTYEKLIKKGGLFAELVKRQRVDTL